jgi:glycosyltransferase involved in cell wall biosynthesis
VRLGVYADLVFRRDGDTLTADRAFVKFFTALPPRVDEVVLFGRLDPTPGLHAYPVGGRAVRFVPLRFYRSVFDVVALIRALPDSCRSFARELSRLDAVWLFGPAPIAVSFALIALRRNVPVLLGVRQDYTLYIRNRLPSKRWTWAIVAARTLDLTFRLMARRAPALTVGDELANTYRGGHAPVLSFGLSLIEQADVVPAEEAIARPWNGDLRVLSVGRLDPEKNPLLLLDVFEGLRARSDRWRLTIVGDGPLAPHLAQEVTRRGLDDVELLGYVPNGPDLWQLYRSSHVFVHTSLTEGLPQVLFEAEAAGLPIVATDVGGVAAALGDGMRGLLVPPRDAGAVVAALERFRTDHVLRERVIRAELQHVSTQTIDAQLDRVAAFIHSNVRVAASGPGEAQR